MCGIKRKLEELGHDVQVIDYRPDYLMQRYALCPNPFKCAARAYKEYQNYSLGYRSYRMFRRFYGTVISYGKIDERIKLNNGFQPFMEKHQNLTQRYTTLQELKKNPPACDAYITGSDQLWNPYVTNSSLDAAYFLDFGDEKICRIAYAISPCQLDTVQYSQELKLLTNRLNAISLREVNKQLKENC